MMVRFVMALLLVAAVLLSLSTTTYAQETATDPTTTTTATDETTTTTTTTATTPDTEPDTTTPEETSETTTTTTTTTTMTEPEEGEEEDVLDLDKQDADKVTETTTTTTTEEAAQEDASSTTTTTTTSSEDTTSTTETTATSKEEQSTTTAAETDKVPPEQQQQQQQQSNAAASEQQQQQQTGPFVDLFGPALLSLEKVDETHVRIVANQTNDALRGKKVVGVYFSADWCGPCRQFTPELVSFYDKINSKRRPQNSFEIVWVSRCRDLNSFNQYFTHMGSWYAMPPDLASGRHGEHLSALYGVKGIPTLVLLDEDGHVITTDARNKIPQDRAGVGFPWNHPLVSLYRTVLPKTLRYMITNQIVTFRQKLISRVKSLVVVATGGGGAKSN